MNLTPNREFLQAEFSTIFKLLARHRVTVLPTRNLRTLISYSLYVPGLHPYPPQRYANHQRAVKALIVVAGELGATVVGRSVTPAVGSLSSRWCLGVAGGILSGAAAAAAGLAALGGGFLAAGRRTHMCMARGCPGVSAALSALGEAVACAAAARASGKDKLCGA